MSVSPVETAPTAASLEPGARLGRFTVVRRVGAGGMGAVYEGHDGELDRSVALKVLAGQQSVGDELRLVREAQALARLSHPNVVSVHEVGHADGGVFIAMEYIDGTTLLDHLAAARRSWREVLALFLQAGRGLAAAHARGLVHRDFKPSNVLIDRAGRARVTDFGLARQMSDVESDDAIRAAANSDEIETLEIPTAEAPPSPAGMPLLAASPITRAGALVGTPHYMAPEQRARLSATARSDQFSFCLSLWEAVFGAPPPRRARGAPRWLARALEAGLAEDPSRRHPSMDRLLEILERAPARRRALLIAGVALLGGAAVTAALLGVAPREEMCRDGARRLAGVWDAPRRDALRAAFAATASPLAAGAAAAVEHALDGWGARWSAAYTDACEATHKRGEQSQAMLDLRMACLGDRLRDAGALVETLTRADRESLSRAPEAATKLRGVAACADAGWLTARVAPPEDAAARERVDRARARLATARALADVGQVVPAQKLTDELVGEAAAIGYAPLIAETALARGQSSLSDMTAMESSLREALAAATRARHDEVALRAMIELGWRLGERGERTDEGLRWLDYAGAVLDRLGHDPELEVALARNRGSVLRVAKRTDESVAALSRALEIAEKLGDEPLVARVENELGIAVSTAGRDAEAPRHFERSLEIARRVEGPLGRLTLVSQVHLATALRLEGRLPEALRLQAQLVPLQTIALGPRHPDVGVLAMNLGNTLEMMGRCPEAIPHYLRSEALFITLNEEIRVGHVLRNLSRCQRQVGQPQEALATAQRALAIAEAHPGGNPDHLTASLVRVGDALETLGRTAEAEAAFRRALADTPPDAPADKLRDHHAAALRGLARMARARGAAREALAFAQRALAVGEARGAQDIIAQGLGEVGETYLALAERVAARTALERALKILDGMPGAMPDDRAEWTQALARAR